jgi:hypothetical protein
MVEIRLKDGRRMVSLNFASPDGNSMAKVELNSITTHFRGRVGDVIFKRYGDKLVASRLPRFKTTKPTASQKPRRELFQAASAYAVIVQTKPGLYAEYAVTAAKAERTVRSLAIRDFMQAGAMSPIDFTDFKARPSVVRVKVEEEFEAASVDFQCRNARGRVVAQGVGELRKGAWQFEVPRAASKQSAVVEVIATATSERGRMMQRRTRVPSL